MRTLTVLVRPGCHLCEEAVAVLERLRADPALPELRIEQVDIEADDALLRAYLERIPVVALDGEELYDFIVDEADLRSRLAEAVRPSR
jgi:predicted thioredoxin/glutaredoxin